MPPSINFDLILIPEHYSIQFWLFSFQIEAFNLTENTNQTKKLKRTFAYNSEDEGDATSDDGDDNFEIDSTALKGILSNTGIKVV